MPNEKLTPTPCPDKVLIGATNFDLLLYLQQLELALMRCNRDKADIATWSTNLSKVGAVYE